jgi:hypothetical protein
MTVTIQESRPLGDQGIPGQSEPDFALPMSLGRGVVVSIYLTGNVFMQVIELPLTAEVAMLNPVKSLSGKDYPALVKLWDNDVDAIYDKI